MNGELFYGENFRYTLENVSILEFAGYISGKATIDFKGEKEDILMLAEEVYDHNGKFSIDIDNSSSNLDKDILYRKVISLEETRIVNVEPNEKDPYKPTISFFSRSKSEKEKLDLDKVREMYAEYYNAVEEDSLEEEFVGNDAIGDTIQRMEFKAIYLFNRVSDIISEQRREIYTLDVPRQIGKSSVSAIFSKMNVVVFSTNQLAASYLCKLGANKENVFTDTSPRAIQGVNFSMPTAVIFDEGFHREDLEFDMMSIRNRGYDGPIIVLGTSREMEIISQFQNERSLIH